MPSATNPLKAAAMQHLLTDLGDMVAMDLSRLQRYLQPLLLQPTDTLTGEQLSRAELAARRARIPKVSGGVVVIRLAGIITPRSWYGTSIESLEQLLDAALASDHIKGIVLDVDSPGGSVYGVDSLARRIYDARGSKPMVAITRHLNASAAYYLSSAVDQLYAEPGSDTGSIGVWNMHVNESGWLEQLGVELRLFSAGKYKVEGHPWAPLDEEGEAEFQRRVDYYYGEFVEAVARHRGVKPADVRGGFGEGRVVNAKKAAELGMVDRVLTMDQLRASMGVARSGSSASADRDLEAMFAEAMGLPVDDTDEAESEAARAPAAAASSPAPEPAPEQSEENLEIRRKRLGLKMQQSRP